MFRPQVSYHQDNTERITTQRDGLCQKSNQIIYCSPKKHLRMHVVNFLHRRFKSPWTRCHVDWWI